jgi:hypothetical protein
MRDQRYDDDDRNQAGDANQFDQRRDLAALVGNDVTGADDLRDIVNRGT